jgi:hypothetical protein
VNLQLNPERYTGYTGDSARRIWDSIYKENCPRCKGMDKGGKAVTALNNCLCSLPSPLHECLSMRGVYCFIYFSSRYGIVACPSQVRCLLQLSRQAFFKFPCIFSDPSEDMCQEKKALYKLISGLHSSISVHIASGYLLDESANEVYIHGPTLYFGVYRLYL